MESINKLTRKLERLDYQTYLHSLSCYKRALTYCDIMDFHLIIKHSVSLACLYHDLGKMYYEDLVTAERPLTDEERYQLSFHPIDSYVICKSAGLPDNICNLVLLHHDPALITLPKLLDEYDGLSREILTNVSAKEQELAETVSMIDVVDALQENRPYRTHQLTFTEMGRIFANQFPTKAYEFMNIV